MCTAGQKVQLAITGPSPSFDLFDNMKNGLERDLTFDHHAIITHYEIAVKSDFQLVVSTTFVVD